MTYRWVVVPSVASQPGSRVGTELGSGLPLCCPHNNGVQHAVDPTGPFHGVGERFTGIGLADTPWVSGPEPVERFLHVEMTVCSRDWWG